MNHLDRFKIVYVQILVAFASSVGGEFVAMKDLKPEELHALTWVVWVVLVTNIIGNTGNTIIALFQPKPPSARDTSLPPANGT
jgi:hypothetical protein